MFELYFIFHRQMFNFNLILLDVQMRRYTQHVCVQVQVKQLPKGLVPVKTKKLWTISYKGIIG